MASLRLVFSFFLLTQGLFLTLIVGLDCWYCTDLTQEECRLKRTTETCSPDKTVCSNFTRTVLNGTTGETVAIVTHSCDSSFTCGFEKALCDLKNTSTKAPDRFLACSLSCCTSGPECVNATKGTTTSTPSTSVPSTLPSTAVTTTELPAAYIASAWTTDMSFCKDKCCGGTPAQIWQNRTCCPVRTGGCSGVTLAKEVKCEDTYCNEKHCGAYKFEEKPLMVMIMGFASVVYGHLSLS